MPDKTSGPSCECGGDCDVVFGIARGQGAAGGLVDHPGTVIPARICGSNGSGTVENVFPQTNQETWKNAMWQAVHGGQMCCGFRDGQMMPELFSAECDAQSDCP